MATQHKPLVFVVRMQRREEEKVVGRKTIKWWKCSEDTAVAYKERLTLDYEKLGTSIGTVEEEWKAFIDAFVGVAEELCGRMSGKGDRHLERKNKLGGRKK